MLLLALTGSIGMGKSEALLALRRLARGAAFYDADAAVHQLYREPAVIAAIKRAFPAAVRGSVVDRKKLGELIFGNPAANAQLRAIVYPHLARLEQRALSAAARRGVRLMVLDVPLLFETGADARIDRALVVTAPVFVQEARVLRRPGMDMARLKSILALQMPDLEKRKAADFIVPTGLGRAHSTRCLQKLLQKIKLLPTQTGAWRRLIYLKEFHARNRT